MNSKRSFNDVQRLACTARLNLHRTQGKKMQFVSRPLLLCILREVFGNVGM